MGGFEAGVVDPAAGALVFVAAFPKENPLAGGVGAGVVEGVEPPKEKPPVFGAAPAPPKREAPPAGAAA